MENAYTAAAESVKNKWPWQRGWDLNLESFTMDSENERWTWSSLTSYHDYRYPYENDHIHGWFFPHFQTNPDEVSLVPIAAHHYLLPKFAPRCATSQIPFAQRGCTWTHRLCFHWYIWFANICSMLAIVLVGGWLYHCPPNVVSIPCHSHQPQVTTSHNPNSPVLNGEHPIA